MRDAKGRFINREGNFDHGEVDICVSQLIENHLGI
jgi:hypothetical protein